jgi:hypothetical protein
LDPDLFQTGSPPKELAQFKGLYLFRSVCYKLDSDGRDKIAQDETDHDAE